MKFYKKFSFKVVVRIIFILATMMAISLIFGDDRLFFNQIILGILLVIQIGELLRFVKITNLELAKFLLAIKHADFSVSFSNTKMGSSFDTLNNAFGEIIDVYKKAKIEKEAQFQYLRMVVSHINIGIISIENDDDITLMNPSAEEILGIKGIRNWIIFKEKCPDLFSHIVGLGDEGRKLIELRQNDEHKTLSVNVSSMVMMEKRYKLITFQDIKNEIEQKEIEAWHKLIRILTHEIMNSATPISSLTETMQSMLKKNGQQITSEQLTDDTVNDLMFSLKTIQKRSDGMLAFIDDYRKITRVPPPVKVFTPIDPLLKEIEVLVKHALEKENITIVTQCAPDLSLHLDQQLIQQVMLNMIKNAEQALQDGDNRQIRLNAYEQNDLVIIDITDNGSGIPAKEMHEIFIPFYTTKKEGSGIGLSLSKQIMHQHGGTIKVKSEPGEGSTFSLIFRMESGGGILNVEC